MGFWLHHFYLAGRKQAAYLFKRDRVMPLAPLQPLLLFRERRLEIEVEIAAERRDPPPQRLPDFGSIAPLDIIDTLLKGKQHFVDQGVLYLPFLAFWLAVASSRR